MPNRKTFDEREKVDHSSHPLMDRQPSDLKADIQDPDDRVVKVADKFLQEPGGLNLEKRGARLVRRTQDDKTRRDAIVGVFGRPDSNSSLRSER